MNVNRNGLHHRNQRPKEVIHLTFVTSGGHVYKCESERPIFQKSTCVPILVDFGGGPLFDL